MYKYKWNLDYEQPDVMVVIPAYNEEKEISKTIEAYKKQFLEIWSFWILVVDNNSNDNTSQIVKDILWEKWIIQEAKKWVQFARKTWINYVKENYNSSKVILQADADTIPVTNGLINAHLKQYEDSNVVWVWWYNYFIDRKFRIKFYYFLKNLFDWKLWKSYYEKRNFYSKKWIMPTPWHNMSYLTDIWVKIKPQEWSSHWEDFYFMTKVLEKALETNKNSFIKFLDEKYWEDAQVGISSRDDSFFRLLQNKKTNLEELINIWINNNTFNLSDIR